MKFADPNERTTSRESEETGIGRDEAPSVLPREDGDRTQMRHP